MTAFIKREDVAVRVMHKWLDAITVANKVSLPLRIPDWENRTNYNLEQVMHEQFGGKWVVLGWCPYDFIYCAYKEVASKDDLREARERVEKSDVNLDKAGLFKFIDTELARRPKNLEDEACWLEGVLEYPDLPCEKES